MYRYRYRARAKTGKRHSAVKATAVEFHVENVEIPFYLFFSHLLRCTFQSRYTFWQHVIVVISIELGQHLNFKTSCQRNLRIGVLFSYVVRCGIYPWLSGASFTRYTRGFVALLDNPPRKILVIKSRKGIHSFGV